MNFYTSDHHFGHARIASLANRPFSSVEEMNRELVSRWNSVVSEKDTVFLLGDLAMGTLTESLEYVAQLNGRKLLVPGNHDRVSSVYRGSEAKKAQWAEMYAAAGLRVLPEQQQVVVGNQLVLLCHFPYDGDSHGEERYADVRPVDTGQWLLHGHTHASEKVRGRQIHVGVDAWNYTPVPEQAIVDLMQGG